MTNLVVSLELSKKLKELGVPQESKFIYVEKWKDTLEETNFDGYCLIRKEDFNYKIHKNAISRFLSDELLRWLPNMIEVNNIVGYLEIWKLNDQFCCRYTKQFINFREKLVMSKNKLFPNALAKMLIYLLEHNLLKAEGLR